MVPQNPTFTPICMINQFGGSERLKRDAPFDKVPPELATLPRAERRTRRIKTSIRNEILRRRLSCTPKSLLLIPQQFTIQTIVGTKSYLGITGSS